MEGQKKSNWAEESEDDWSDQEYQTPERNSQPIAQNFRRENLISSIKNQCLPCTVYLANLSYRITKKDLRSELQLSDSAEIYLEQGERGLNGMGAIKVSTAADALKVAERHDTEVSGRSFYASLSKQGYPKGASGGGRRGRTARGGRGGKRGYDDQKGYDRSDNEKKEYTKYNRGFESDDAHENDRDKEERPRPERNDKPYERKFELKERASEALIKFCQEVLSQENLSIKLQDHSMISDVSKVSQISGLGDVNSQEGNYKADARIIQLEKKNKELMERLMEKKSRVKRLKDLVKGLQEEFWRLDVKAKSQKNFDLEGFRGIFQKFLNGLKNVDLESMKILQVLAGILGLSV